MSNSPRHGTEFDVEDLRLTFRQLGFDCEVHEDRTRAQMLDIFLNGGQSEFVEICTEVECIRIGYLVIYQSP